MILYHGSNIEVQNPRIMETKRLLDFGRGFYLTSDFEQAKKWAVRTTNRREEGEALISVFEIEEKELEDLQVLRFDTANKEWLKYISTNRTDKSAKDSYDVVIGPVANDQAIRTVNNYIKGYFNEDIAIQLLLPQKLKDQYTFKTKNALLKLRFNGVKKV